MVLGHAFFKNNFNIQMDIIKAEHITVSRFMWKTHFNGILQLASINTVHLCSDFILASPGWTDDEFGWDKLLSALWGSVVSLSFQDPHVSPSAVLYESRLSRNRFFKHVVMLSSLNVESSAETQLHVTKWQRTWEVGNITLGCGHNSIFNAIVFLLS